MLSLLPSGILGWVTASLLAAFISTMSTQVNLGASYLVNDVWVRFMRPDASDGQKVAAGRWATLLSLLAGASLSLTLTSAVQAFNLLLLLGAGTGGLFLLRWFWWRISAATEIAAMAISLVVAVYFTWIHDSLGWLPMADWVKLIAGSLITTAGWVLATFLLPAEHPSVLQGFVNAVHPGGPGWSSYKPEGPNHGEWNVPQSLLQAFLGCLAVYGTLLGVGSVIFGHGAAGMVFGAITGLSVQASLSFRKGHHEGLRHVCSRAALSIWRTPRLPGFARDCHGHQQAMPTDMDTQTRRLGQGDQRSHGGHLGIRPQFERSSRNAIARCRPRPQGRQHDPTKRHERSHPKQHPHSGWMQLFDGIDDGLDSRMVSALRCY